MRRLLVRLFAVSGLVAVAALAIGWWWVHHPLALKAPAVDLSVEPGTRPRGVAQAVFAAGVDVSPELLFLWFRLSGQSRQIKAGSYELTPGISPRTLLSKLTRGEESLQSVVLVEGWTFRQIRHALSKEEHLNQKTRGLDDDSVMQMLGRPGQAAEGLFFPDTYTFSKGSTDLALLKRALHAMDRQIEGRDTCDYLWSQKHVIPFLKVDKGLADEVNGAQVMKPIGGLDDLLGRALAKGVFGTKMRSVIKVADAAGVSAVVGQQFDIGKQILAAGLMPIIEPEVDINSPSKQEAEGLLKQAILDQLGTLGGQQVMLKLTIPTEDDFYADVIAHPGVLRVVALSGGYTREDANARLARNHGMIASFSRALSEGLSAQQSAAEFDATLDASIASIAAASRT